MYQQVHILKAPYLCISEVAWKWKAFITWTMIVHRDQGWHYVSPRMTFIPPAQECTYLPLELIAIAWISSGIFHHPPLVRTYRYQSQNVFLFMRLLKEWKYWFNIWQASTKLDIAVGSVLWLQYFKKRLILVFKRKLYHVYCNPSVYCNPIIITLRAVNLTQGYCIWHCHLKKGSYVWGSRNENMVKTHNVTLLW